MSELFTAIEQHAGTCVCLFIALCALITMIRPTK